MDEQTNIAEYALQALQLAEALTRLGRSVEALYAQAYVVIRSGNDPTIDDWTTLKAHREELETQLQSGGPYEGQV